jgi:hypothetical protein
MVVTIDARGLCTKQPPKLLNLCSHHISEGLG